MTNEVTNLVEAVTAATGVTGADLSGVLKKQLIDVVQSAISAGKDVVNFTCEQAPLLVNEIIRFSACEYGFYSLIGIIFMIVAYKISRFCIKKAKDAESYDEAPWVLGGILGTIIPGLIGIIAFVDNFPTFIKTLVAPRLFLIEYISNLVK